MAREENLFCMVVQSPEKHKNQVQHLLHSREEHWDIGKYNSAIGLQFSF
jgi:hypothetical protein